MSLTDWWDERCKCGHSRNGHAIHYTKFYECLRSENRKPCECKTFQKEEEKK